MMKGELVARYSNMVPGDLKLIIKMLNEPKDDLDWSLVMYVFENSGRGVITLGKVSSYFSLDQKECYRRLNRLSGFWFSQYLNKSEYKIYYTFEMNELSADLLVDMVKFLRADHADTKEKTTMKDV